MVLVLAQTSITAMGQSPVRVAALPKATAPVNDSDYVVGTHDSAGVNKTYKYPVKALATYGSSIIPLAKVLSNGATARQGYSLGKLKSLHPYSSFQVSIDPTDSSCSILAQDTSHANGVQIRTDGGIAQVNAYGAAPSFNLNSVSITTGSGSPEGVVSAVRGSLYFRIDGGAATTLYVKETGTGNTGWVGK